MAVWRGGRWGRSVCSRHSQRRGRQVGRGEVSALYDFFAAVVAFLFFFVSFFYLPWW